MKGLRLAADYFVIIGLCFVIGNIAGWTFVLGWPAIFFVLWKAIEMFYVGCAEETMFRYLLYDKLLQGKLAWSSTRSAVVSSVVFGLAHLFNYPMSMLWAGVPQVLSTTAAGAVFAFVYRKHGLVPCILLHAGWNWFVAIMAAMGN